MSNAKLRIKGQSPGDPLLGISTTALVRSSAGYSEEEQKKPHLINPSPLSSIKIPAWLSIRIRLDSFSNQEQTFCITGWINVFWSGSYTKKVMEEFLSQKPKTKPPTVTTVISTMENLAQEKSKQIEISSIGGKAVGYTNISGDKIIKIVDLRDSDMTNYVPIDATKIFYDASTKSVEHKSAPALYYNKRKDICYTRYHITATLSEHLELNDFPFDRQFLNIKLRWNCGYYRLLNVEYDKVETKTEKWMESIEPYHRTALRVNRSEQMSSQVKMYKPWVEFNYNNKRNEPGIDDEYSHPLIRLRIKRYPRNFILSVLVPFFIIVSCSFAIYAIDINETADRLAVSVTILLTFTAFQSMVDQELPKTSETEWIDIYILSAYAIQASVIFEVCVLPLIIRHGDIDAHVHPQYEMVWFWVILFIWLAISFVYVIHICCGLREDRDFWESRAESESKAWDDNDEEEEDTFERYPPNDNVEPTIQKIASNEKANPTSPLLTHFTK